MLFGQECERIRSLLSIRPCVWIGKLSYSLYLYHFGVLTVLCDLRHTDDLQGASDRALYFAMTLALAVVGEVS